MARHGETRLRSSGAEDRGDAAERPRKHEKDRVFDSTPSRIRTYDLRIRSPLLYPAELWAHAVL
jgi:hypothetical protein